MFERFTERAHQVVVFAREEARITEINFISTEHVLVGLLREEEGLAARVLASLDVTLEIVREKIAEEYERLDLAKEPTEGQIPFTPRAKKVLELALREALSLGHNYIGTEHILLGVVRENEGLHARILTELVAKDDEGFSSVIRNEIIRMLSGPGSRRREKTVLEADAERQQERDAAFREKLREGVAGVVGIPGFMEQAVGTEIIVDPGETPDDDVLVLIFRTPERTFSIRYRFPVFMADLLLARENARHLKELPQ